MIDEGACDKANPIVTIYHRQSNHTHFNKKTKQDKNNYCSTRHSNLQQQDLFKSKPMIQQFTRKKGEDSEIIMNTTIATINNNNNSLC